MSRESLSVFGSFPQKYENYEKCEMFVINFENGIQSILLFISESSKIEMFQSNENENENENWNEKEKTHRKYHRRYADAQELLIVFVI